MSKRPTPNPEDWSKSTGYAFIPVPALRAALDAVERGEADAALGEPEAFAPLLAEAGGMPEIVRGNVKVHPGVAMALRADDIDLRFAFEDLIHDSRKTETPTA